MDQLLDGSFVSNGTAFNLSLPSGYTEFKLVNITDVGSAAAATPVMRAYGTSLMAPGSAYLNLKTNGAATLQLESMILANGFTFWDAKNPPVFAPTAVTAVTAASPAVVTSAAHGLVVGDTVEFSGLNGTMGLMNGQTFSVIAVGGANTFTISLDTSDVAAGRIGNTPANAGFVKKVIVSPFSPQNVVIGPTAVTVAAGNQILLNMNTIPSLAQGASQYSPFLRPYQVGARLRLYIPPLSVTQGSFGFASNTNGIVFQITQINTQAGYAFPNQLQGIIIPGGPNGTITTAAGLGALFYGTGGAPVRSSYPLVTDIAEQSGILSEAEDNTGIRGITIGTGVQTTGKLYQWWARNGFNI